MRYVWFVLIGLAAGWLAGQIMRDGRKGRELDLVTCLIVGVLGSLLGGFLFGVVGIGGGGLVGALLVATVGSVALLALLPLIKDKL